MIFKDAEVQLSSAEVNQYGDQVESVQKAMDAVRDNKSVHLAEELKQLRVKVIAVIVARKQRSASAVCVEVDAESPGRRTRCEGRVLIAPLQ